MSASFDDMQEMYAGFVADSREMLEEIEPRLIELQQRTEDSGAADPDTLNAIFRLFHSLKGAAGFLNLKNVSTVTHEAENLLNRVREGKLVLRTSHTDILCKTCDLIHGLLALIEEQGTDCGREDQIATIVAALVSACQGQQATAADQQPDISTEQGEPSPGRPALVAQHDAATPEPSELIKVTLTPEMLTSFVQESDELLEAAEQSLLNIDKAADHCERLNTAFRSIHSFKGNCGFMGFADPERLSHRIETVLEQMREGRVAASDENTGLLLRTMDALRNAVAEISRGATSEIKGLDLMADLLHSISAAPAGESPRLKLGEILIARGEASADAVDHALDMQNKPLGDILIDMGAASRDAVDAALAQQARQTDKKIVRRDIRVDLDKLDSMIDLVGELVIAQLMVVHSPDLKGYEFENFSKAAHHLERITSELQDVAMAIRMVPLSATFRKMIRLVHDLSHKSGKKVRLDLKGEETEVDKTVIEQIADPLVHIIRNAIDHGIEPLETRRAAGKDEAGTITLDAKHDGGEVLITVHDDGAGLNRDRILKKGLEKGLVNSDPSSLRDQDIYRLIFAPGFSTAAVVTDVSGRGVGMDVVKKNIEKLKGSVDIHSTPGKGAIFVLRIPLTLAIIDGMLVRTGQSLYIIPLLAIRESLRPEPQQITVLPDGTEVVKVREELLPVVRLHALYDVAPDHTELHKGLLAIIEHQGEAVCLFLDEVVGQQQTVIKALPGYMSTIQGISGCSILGDGQVCLIIDVGSLIAKAKRNLQAGSKAAA